MSRQNIKAPDWIFRIWEQNRFWLIFGHILILEGHFTPQNRPNTNWHTSFHYLLSIIAIGISQHNVGTSDMIFRIWGKSRLFLAYFWPNFGPGDHHKPQNRSKRILTYQFPSYMTIDSHWGCPSTITRHQIGLLGFGGLNRLFSAYFLPIFGPGDHHKPPNRSKRILAYQFPSYMTIDRMSQHTIEEPDWIFGIWGQNQLFSGYFWPIFGPGDHHKPPKQVKTHTGISVSIIYEHR